MTKRLMLIIALTTLSLLLSGATTVFANADEDECYVDIVAVEHSEDQDALLITYDSDAEDDCLSHTIGLGSIPISSASVLWLADENTGAPPPETGFRPQNENNVEPNRRGEYLDRWGGKWKFVPEGKGHGGPHWDVTLPKRQGGGHINVHPPLRKGDKWKLIGGSATPKGKRKYENRLESAQSHSESPGFWRNVLGVGSGVVGGYLLYRAGRTLGGIGLVFVPVPGARVAAGFLLLAP